MAAAKRASIIIDTVAQKTQMVFYTKYKIIKKKEKKYKRIIQRMKIRVARAKVLEVCIYIYMYTTLVLNAFN